MLNRLEGYQPRNLTIDELEADDCRFVIGEVSGARYCGLPVFKRSFCAHCFSICYEPPKDRRAA